MCRRNNPNGASTRVLGPPAARQRGEGGRNPVAEETAKASQTPGPPGRDGLYNTEEASAAKERARRRTRTRGRRRVEWLGPHAEGAEGAEGRAARTVYGASTCIRECAPRTSRRRRRSRRSHNSHRITLHNGRECLCRRDRGEDAADRQTEDGGDSVFFVSVGVPRDFSLEASKAPVLFHQKWCFLGCLLVLAWGETTNRTMADGREWYSCRTIRCGSGSWQDCGAGLWNRRQAHGVLAVTGSIPLGGSPRLLSVTRALLP